MIRYVELVFCSQHDLEEWDMFAPEFNGLRWIAKKDGNLIVSYVNPPEELLVKFDELLHSTSCTASLGIVEYPSKE